ncbi:tetratricopeptide repeat protein [Actinospica durhamensis]|uniref:Tetratricopeptide repeat protein n=1 Tax=Actinospica durhamensis TaxID=1508375 RepID=A0A941EMS7_9ACTN|nr:tetratricopeptide repeat protein [Actinospica durhamensis]MBR7834557.1 tetratricopeptide repeat protein [Actinospica durhamensis]
MENAAELDRRARLYDGWIAPHHIDVLIEHGHVREVQRLAEEGDWYCARAIAARHAARGRHEDALALLTPFADTGWWYAVESIAELLADSGRADEAIELAVGHAESGDRAAVNYAAELLARDGRVDEAFALLRPRIRHWCHAQALVRISDGLGRDEQVLEELREFAAAAPPRERWRAAQLRATVLERSGRVDDAVAALQQQVHVQHVTFVNIVEHLADLLARHGRHEELRALIDGHGGDQAAYRLAGHLEQAGDVDGAMELLEPLAASGRPNPSVLLAELLVRAGRADEALSVLRRALVGGEEDWLLHTWAELMAASGRTEEALTVLDELADGPFGMTWELFEQRLGLLAAGGRIGQAVQELREHPRSGEWYATWRLSELLAADGRDEEALEVLESGPDHSMSTDLRARLLIGRGRAEEAVAMLRRPRFPPPEPDLWG